MGERLNLVPPLRLQMIMDKSHQISQVWAAIHIDRFCLLETAFALYNYYLVLHDQTSIVVSSTIQFTTIESLASSRHCLMFGVTRQVFNESTF